MYKQKKDKNTWKNVKKRKKHPKNSTVNTSFGCGGLEKCTYLIKKKTIIGIQCFVAKVGILGVVHPWLSIVIQLNNSMTILNLIEGMI